MKDRLTIPKMERLQDELNLHTYTCNCGHRVLILPQKDKVLCNWCKHYVFKNKRDEFKYRMNEKIRRCNNERENI